MQNIQRLSVMKKIQDYTWKNSAFPSLFRKKLFFYFKSKYTRFYQLKTEIIILKMKHETSTNL